MSILVNFSIVFLNVCIHRVFYISACLFPMSSGLAAVWTSPVVNILKANATHINPLGRTVTVFELSWITSLFTLGIAIGPLVLAKLADFFGRKWSLIFISTLQMCGFIILAFGNHVNYYYISRLTQGLSTGFMITVLPLFLAEISENFNRGKFGTFLNLFATLGNLLGYILGLFLDMKTFTLIFAVPSIINVLLFTIFIPESPVYLAMKQKNKQALISLEKFRNVNSHEANKILTEIEDMLEKSSKNRKFCYITRLFLIRKSFAIGLGLSAIQAFSGIFIIMGYLQSILSTTNLTISESLTVVLLGIIQVFLAILSTVLIEKLGRKILLLYSLGLIVTAFLLLGTYFTLRDAEFYHISNISWLPLISLIIYIVGYSIGVGPVIFVLKGEIFPLELNTVGVMICMMSLGVLTFFVTFSFPLCNEFLGTSWSFWILAFLNALGFTFTLVLVSETKGKSFLEIQEMLNGKE